MRVTSLTRMPSFFAESRIICTNSVYSCAYPDHQFTPSQRVVARVSFFLSFIKNVATAECSTTTVAEASVRLQIMP
jgi:hypothetical protein